MAFYWLFLSKLIYHQRVKIYSINSNSKQFNVKACRQPLNRNIIQKMKVSTLKSNYFKTILNVDMSTVRRD